MGFRSPGGDVFGSGIPAALGFTRLVFSLCRFQDHWNRFFFAAWLLCSEPGVCPDSNTEAEAWVQVLAPELWTHQLCVHVSISEDDCFATVEANRGILPLMAVVAASMTYKLMHIAFLTQQFP